MPLQNWKNHWVIYCFHYSKRWIMILSGLKFPVSNRENKPCLHQQQHDATGACQYSKVMGSEEPKAILCALGVCSSLLPRLHTHATGVHQVLISQLVFQKAVHLFGPCETFSQSGSKPSKWGQTDLLLKSLNPNVSSNTRQSQTRVWMQEVSSDHVKWEECF